jgi:hypothetical protein
MRKLSTKLFASLIICLALSVGAMAGDISSGRGGDISSGRDGDISSGKGGDISSGKGGDISSGKAGDISSGISDLIVNEVINSLTGILLGD